MKTSRPSNRKALGSRTAWLRPVVKSLAVSVTGGGGMHEVVSILVDTRPGFILIEPDHRGLVWIATAAP